MPETVETKDGGVVEKTIALRLIVLAYYETVEELQAAHPTGEEGDCYKVGDDLYLWGESNSWVNIGSLKGEKGDPGDDGLAITDEEITELFYNDVPIEDDTNDPGGDIPEWAVDDLDESEIDSIF